MMNKSSRKRKADSARAHINQALSALMDINDAFAQKPIKSSAEMGERRDVVDAMVALRHARTALIPR